MAVDHCLSSSFGNENARLTARGGRDDGCCCARSRKSSSWTRLIRGIKKTSLHSEWLSRLCTQTKTRTRTYIHVSTQTDEHKHSHVSLYRRTLTITRLRTPMKTHIHTSMYNTVYLCNLCTWFYTITRRRTHSPVCVHRRTYEFTQFYLQRHSHVWVNSIHGLTRTRNYTWPNSHAPT